MRKLVLVSFASVAVLSGGFGMAALSLLIWEFLFPGSFELGLALRGGMPLNLVVLLLFGFQHSLMPRAWFKRELRRVFPIELERSVYVLVSGFTLFFVVALWSPGNDPFYDLRGTVGGGFLLAGAIVGAGLIALAGLTMGGADLLGLTALRDILRERPPATEVFRSPGVYKYVRHPLYLGMLMLFWLTPAMTRDHMFFAEVMTAYILIGIYFEEKDLVRKFGTEYVEYQRKVPMLLPFLKWNRGK